LKVFNINHPHGFYRRAKGTALNRFKSGVVGVLIAVVMFGGIQVASAHSSSCTRVGATKMQSAKKFRCVKTAGKLVWKVTPTKTTTTTVPSTTTVASTTTVVVVPTVSIPVTWLQGNTWPKAVSVTSNVVGTVYLVEGASVVSKVSDITSLTTEKWMKASITQTSTPTVVSVDVEALTNGYYRVYVANTAGVLSAPAINKVTISITRACTSNCTTTTVAVTCAAGGTCVVGDTGPGGGIVFYVASTAFTATGTTCNTTCLYLEAAASGWSASPNTASLCAATAGTSTSDPRCAWAGRTVTNKALTTNFATLTTSAAHSFLAGDRVVVANVDATFDGTFTITAVTTTTFSYAKTASDVTSVSATGNANKWTAIGLTAQGVNIGTGYSNTSAIIADDAGAGRAATASRAYQGGSKTDWFLPSKDELNEMCFYFSAVAKNGGGRCNGNAVTGRAGVGGFATDHAYWSSSEDRDNFAWYQYLDGGYQVSVSEHGANCVRPVRAF